jgi:hypothetical protein
MIHRIRGANYRRVLVRRPAPLWLWLALALIVAYGGSR